MPERNLEELAKIAGKYATTSEIGVREMQKKDVFGRFFDTSKKRPQDLRPKFREETNPQGGDSEMKTRITHKK